MRDPREAHPRSGYRCEYSCTQDKIKGQLHFHSGGEGAGLGSGEGDRGRTSSLPPLPRSGHPVYSLHLGPG